MTLALTNLAATKDGWRWIVDAHGNGRRYIVHSDELLSAFLELEARLLAPTLGTSANLKF